MKARIMMMMLVFSIACQTGRIPCPKPEIVRSKKVKVSNFSTSATSLSAKALPENEASGIKTTKAFRITDTKIISNISSEEWDCPREGKRKYMPKEVKENIRKNMRKIKSTDEKDEPDTLSVSTP